MKRLLLLATLVLVGILGWQQESQTQTTITEPVPTTVNGSAVTSAATFRAAQTANRQPAVAEAELRAAATKALKLIQQSQKIWATKETCSSCHHQLLPEIPFAMARERGVAFDEAFARNATTSAFASFKDFDGAVQGYDYIDVFFDGWTLVSAHNAGIRPNLSTAAAAQFIASRQRRDGSWGTIDDRPPQAHSPFAATAICVQAVQNYLPENLRREKAQRVQSARQWLLKTKPLTTEDKAFQLFGLRWTSADAVVRRNVARQLLSEQREDGGWSQLPGLPSDAYATGEVLAALSEGIRLGTTDPIYQRGLRFLLKAQQADGSWRVHSRLYPPAPVSPPYFETGFPYQHDQFISIMASSWATTALLAAVPQQTKGKTEATALTIAPEENAEWMRVALSGSAAELKRLLDAGISANAKTTEGTTALMLAARDAEKVKLLIERGADVKARAATGFNALMVASRYGGNAEVVRLLLKHGAQPNTDKNVEVRNEASALFFAVTSEDVETVKALVEAGAKLNETMKLLGRIPTSSMLYAALGGDVAMVDYLLSKGANANETDELGISLLGWAAINNRANLVQLLLARGAAVNHQDSFGMTPLLYAASIDYGETTVMEKLLAARADVKIKNKNGQTALDLTKTYHHDAMTGLLEKKMAAR